MNRYRVVVREVIEHTLEVDANDFPHAKQRAEAAVAVGPGNRPWASTMGQETTDRHAVEVEELP